jgi:hypothetical protein
MRTELEELLRSVQQLQTDAAVLARLVSDGLDRPVVRPGIYRARDRRAPWRWN